MYAASQPVGITHNFKTTKYQGHFFGHLKPSHYKTRFILSLLSVRAEMQKCAGSSDQGAIFLGAVLILSIER